MVVLDAVQRAGLRPDAPPAAAPAATAMLHAGSPLSEIEHVPRHRSALATAIYAK